jgi:trigger factor
MSMVREEGFEPSTLSGRDPKSRAFASSATLARQQNTRWRRGKYLRPSGMMPPSGRVSHGSLGSTRVWRPKEKNMQETAMTIRNYTEHSSTRKTLEIEIPAETVGVVTEEVVRAYARRANIPGFRKGHAPESLIAKRFAEEIKDEIIERMLPPALEEAIREKQLETIGRPLVEEIKLEAGAPLVFVAHVDVKPAIDLPEYEGVSVQDESVEPSPAEIGAVLDRLRESHAEFLPIEDRAARDGDYAIVDVAGTFVRILEPGQNPETFRDEKLMLEIGHADSMAEINDALRGLLPGGRQTFRKSFPEDFPNERFRGQTVDYEVTLLELKEKKLPELDDEFARHVADAESTAALRERLAEGLRRDKRAGRRRRLRREILDTLLSRIHVETPEVLIESELEGMMRDYARYVASAGIDPKNADWEKLQPEFRPRATRRVQEYLLLDAIAQKEGLTASETEVDAELRGLAERSHADFAAVRDNLARSGRLEGIREEIRLNKAVDRLIEKAHLRPSEEPVIVEADQ